MKIYPVKVTKAIGSEAEEIIVHAQSSIVAARKFRTEKSREDDTLESEILQSLDIEANKAGLMFAFRKGQELAGYVHNK